MTKQFCIVGEVVAGRGNATSQIHVHLAELQAAVGENLIAGTLNLIFRSPVLLVEARAITAYGGAYFLWPALIDEKPVWLFRWTGAPLHVVEVLSDVHLRTCMRLRDGDTLMVVLNAKDVTVIPLIGRIVWGLCWIGRRRWCYTHDAYYSHAKRWCFRFGATQQDSKKAREHIMSIVRRLVHKAPGLNSLASRLRRLIRRKRELNAQYLFERTSLDVPEDPEIRSFRQIHNVLNYTKTSGSRYSAKQYPAGYHTIEINGRRLQGQRDPRKRLAHIPVDFRGKSVLDIGCNQGGMLLELDRSLKWGVGIDYDPRMINAANRIRSLRGGNNLHFYVFDLDQEPLDLIEDLIPEAKVDVVFLLAVCLWIRRWREVIQFGVSISNCMVFETTGTDKQQSEQQDHLEGSYQHVSLLAESSEDDPQQKRRKLFLCENGIAAG